MEHGALNNSKVLVNKIQFNVIRNSYKKSLIAKVRQYDQLLIIEIDRQRGKNVTRIEMHYNLKKSVC